MNNGDDDTDEKSSNEEHDKENVEKTQKEPGEHCTVLFLLSSIMTNVVLIHRFIMYCRY